MRNPSMLRGYLALLLLALALASALVERARLAGTVPIEGRVVAIERAERGGPYGDAERLVIEFTLAGRSHRVRTARAVWEIFDPAYRTVGARIALRADPADPSGARIATAVHLYPVTATLLVLTAIATAVTAWSLTPAGRRRAAEDRARVARWRAARRPLPARGSARPGRERLLRSLRAGLALAALAVALVLLAVVTREVLAMVAAVALAALAYRALRRSLRCPRCATDLRPGIAANLPRGMAGNWLVIHDYLRQGGALHCPRCRWKE